MDISDKCRACLKKEGALLIFTVYGNDRINIKKIFETYTGIKVEQEDNMPKSLCNDCFNCLLATHTFITRCRRTDSMLHTWASMCNLNESVYEIVLIDETAQNFTESKIKNDLEVVEEDIKDKLSELGVYTELNDDTVLEIKDSVDIEMNNEAIDKKISEKLVTEQHVLQYKVCKSEGITGLDDSINGVSLNIAFKPLVESTQLYEHQLSETTNNDSEVIDKKNKICAVCSKAFESKKMLIDHLNTHTKEKPYECSLCSACFSSRSNLKKHIRIHNGERPYVCDICEKAFTESSTLRNHREIHWDKQYFLQGDQIVCIHCSERFNKKEVFQQHLINKHGSLEINEDKKTLSYFCGICHHYLSSKRALVLHMGTHTEIKNYLCSICGKRFKSKSILDVHMVVHTARAGNVCSYENCQNSKRKCPTGITFHHFPSLKFCTEERLESWVKNCGNSELIGMSPASLAKKVICGNHFTPESYLPNSNRLRRDAVPTDSCSPVYDFKVLTPIKTYERKKFEFFQIKEEADLLSFESPNTTTKI